MNNKRLSFHHYSSYHVGNSKFQELCPRNSDEDQYVFLTINHDNTVLILSFFTVILKNKF